MAVNRFAIEEYSTVFCHWFEVTAFTDIVTAVKEYQFRVEENPATAYRLVELHAVME